MRGVVRMARCGHSKALGICGVVVLIGATGCSGASTPSARVAGASVEPAKNDESRCEYLGRLDREVFESVGHGSQRATIRRVYGLANEGERTRGGLLCREVDTNHDGIKDVVRFYDEFGEKAREQADSDYDGKPDTWTQYSQGRVSRVELDHSGDGQVQETRFYVDGSLSRIQIDTNQDGKPDIWEIYSSGHLERMGEDLNFDGRVDRWNRGEAPSAGSQDPEAGGEPRNRQAGS